MLSISINHTFYLLNILFIIEISSLASLTFSFSQLFPLYFFSSLLPLLPPYLIPLVLFQSSTSELPHHLSMVCILFLLLISPLYQIFSFLIVKTTFCFYFVSQYFVKDSPQQYSKDNAIAGIFPGPLLCMACTSILS